MRRLIIPALLICLSLPAGSAGAAPASDWSSSGHAAIRLLDGGERDDGTGRRAGLEMRLDPGFKTYWRTPGDSGVPPTFDWSGSTNIRDVEVLWPAPHRFDDSAGSSIGYGGELILPLRVTLANPKAPATLSLAIDYAVCEKLCIPARGQARIQLVPGLGGSMETPRIEAFEAKVPQPIAARPGPAPAILSVQRHGEETVAVSATIPAKGVADLFVEGPDGWVFGAPRPVSSRPAPDGAIEVVYHAGVDARPDKASPLAGVPVTVTLATETGAIELRQRLDAGDPPR
jgi:suppressor for copper-sensitivity B